MWRSSNEITMDILNNEVRLDSECWSCDGGKTEPIDIHIAEDGTCTVCEGKGYELTSAGKAIMDLMERHGGSND